MNTKICSKCKSDKDVEEFYKSSSTGKLRPTCKECTIRLNKESKSRRDLGLPRLRDLKPKPHGSTDNPEYNSNAQIKYKYGITIEDYNKILVKQEERCAICGRHQCNFDKKLHIDHDHKTGKIRGLLCYNCNHAIGKFFDNTEYLQNAINYLNNNK